MNIILAFDSVKNRIKRLYREYIFFKRTGCKAALVGDIVLINQNLKLGKNVVLYPGATLWGDGLIEIGDNVGIGSGTIIYASKNGGGGVKIGSNTRIAAQCYIIDMDHGMAKGELIREQKNTVKRIEIGSDVWIAANCTILKGSRIGDGAVLGAKSLVKGEIESNGIAVGVPAAVIKYRE